MVEKSELSTFETLAEDVDLGTYEIKAYLAVVEHGELTAGEITERTSIPQPRVYDTVRSLSDRGFVELQESRPLRVVAISPEEAFSELRSSLEELTDSLEALYRRPGRNQEAATLVKSRATILRHLESTIERANYELTLSLTPDLVSRFEGVLGAAIDRDVTIELLVAPAADAPDPIEYDYARIATAARTRRGITTPVLAVADGDSSIYATQRAVSGGSDRYGVIFNRSSLGFLVLGFFGTVLWTTAEPVLDPDPVAGPDLLPRWYASIRRCVKDLRAVDGEVHIQVEGRDVLTGEPQVVSGRVVDTAFEETQEVATIELDTGRRRLTIGGRMATYEDVEAHEIRLVRDGHLDDR